MEAAVQMQAPQQTQAAVQAGGYYRSADGVGTGFVKTSGVGVNDVAEGIGSTFEAMLSGMLSSSGSGSQEQLTLIQQLEDEMEENGTDAAMQMMAELLLAQPTLLAQMDPSMLMQMNSMGGGQVGLEALTGMFTGQDQSALLAAMQNLTPQQLEQLKNDPQAFAKGLLEQVGIPVEVVQSGLANVQVSEDTLMGQAGFQRALYQVRQAQSTGDGEKKFSDLEAVLGVTKNTQTPQNDVAVSGVFAQQMTQATVGQVEQLSDNEMIDLQAILAQLKTGITENVQKGENDFVIKLKPEGLGEITVRMSEQAGKISMEIHASSQYTQRLLSNEIGSLRQVMEPYHVVVNTTQASADSTSFDMEQQMRQGFAQQQQSGQQSHANYYAPQDDVADTQEPTYFSSVPSSDLDTYI